MHQKSKNDTVARFLLRLWYICVCMTRQKALVIRTSNPRLVIENRGM